MRRLMHIGCVVVGMLLICVTLFEVSLPACPPQFFSEEIQRWLSAHRSVGHPVLGALERPHATGLFVEHDFRVPYRTDAQGFHNPWPWTERPDIVVVGDGMTVGYGVDAGQAWPALVAQTIAPNQVLNLALLEAGPLQYARTYALFGAPRHPRLLFIGLSLTDDWQDAVLFERWQHTGWGSNYRVWRASGGISGSWSAPLGAAHALLAQQSLFYQLIRASLATERGTSRLIWLPGGTYLQVQPGHLMSMLRALQPGQHAFTLILEALTYAQVIARAHGTQIVVVCLPSKEEVYLPLRHAPAVDPGRLVRDALAQRGITTLDLAPLLRQESAKGAQLFFPLSRYLNAQGHAFVARQVLQYLMSTALILSLRPWEADPPGLPLAHLPTP